MREGLGHWGSECCILHGFGAFRFLNEVDEFACIEGYREKLWEKGCIGGANGYMGGTWWKWTL